MADALTSAERATIGRRTTELVRALIASAARDEVDSREAMAELADDADHLVPPPAPHRARPQPCRIAREHNISVRWLYDNWTGELSVVQWIIRERLELARRDLAGPRKQSIARVARQCGFTDPAHFSRRFRETFGMSPREWRRLNKDRFGPR